MRGKGFTLIELLIVVAIIAILAAIAVPNFLEAQVRAKVARVKADLRSTATALEAYAVDNNVYPPYGRVDPTGQFIQYPARVNNMNDLMCFGGPSLTTPVAYITGFFRDPFMRETTPDVMPFYEYLNITQHVANFPKPHPQAWMDQILPAWGMWRLVGAGPDMDRGLDIKSNIVYDATNGTASDGDIVRWQRNSDSVMNTQAP
jgi:prepilin-type N-terminal cleavage/methylation domain-containing protein